jgi:hypothetical protein
MGKVDWIDTGSFLLQVCFCTEFCSLSLVIYTRSFPRLSSSAHHPRHVSLSSYRR